MFSVTALLIVARIMSAFGASVLKRDLRRIKMRNLRFSISEIRLESRPDNKSSLSVESGSSTSGFGSGGARGHLTWTPPASVEGSTPTWTEGTPSFTESSSSGDIGERGRRWFGSDAAQRHLSVTSLSAPCHCLPPTNRSSEPEASVNLFVCPKDPLLKDWVSSRWPHLSEFLSRSVL